MAGIFRTGKWERICRAEKICGGDLRLFPEFGSRHGGLWVQTGAEKSGRGQPRSKTLSRPSVRISARFWSAAVLCRFGFRNFDGGRVKAAAHCKQQTKL